VFPVHPAVDHSLIFDEVRKIEANRSDNLIPTNMKQLFDSIKASSQSNSYDIIKYKLESNNCDD